MKPLIPSPLTNGEATALAERNQTTIFHEHNSARADENAPFVLPHQVATFEQREAKIQTELDKIAAEKATARNLVREWEKLCVAAEASIVRCDLAAEQIAAHETAVETTGFWIAENIGQTFTYSDVPSRASHLSGLEATIVILKRFAAPLPQMREDAAAAVLAFAKTHKIPRDVWPDCIAQPAK